MPPAALAMHQPVEPPPSQWVFPPVGGADDDGPVAVGGDLEPGTLLAAYRRGLFPMPLRPGGPVGWWSPDPRAVLDLADFPATRSSILRAVKRFEISVDHCFADVVRHCGDPRRPHGWIDEQIVEAYTGLHELGWAHSVEVWLRGRLVGGIYGVGIGAFFAGESMFHLETDASKVAVAALVERLAAGGVTLFDVQWQTDHLATLGVREIERDAYLERLEVAVAGRGPTWDPEMPPPDALEFPPDR